MSTQGFGSRLAAIAFGILAFAMVCVTVIMSGTYSATLALSDWDRGIQAASAISADLMGFALAFAVAMCFKYRRFGMGVFLIFPLLAYAGYSTQSVVGFGAVARVAKDIKVTAEVDAEKRAVQEANAAAFQLKQENLEWMRATAYSRAQRKDRFALMSEIRDEVNKPIEVKVAKSEGVVGDPAAEQLAGLLSGWGVLPRGIQIGQVVWLGILVVMGKILGSFLMGYFWPRKAVQEVANKDAEAKPRLAAYRPPTRPNRAPLRDVAEESEDAVVAAVQKDVEQQTAWRRQAQAFFEEATYADVDARNSSTDIYLHYVEWARQLAVPSDQMMSHNRFGRVCTALLVPRDASDSKKAWWPGIALVDFAEDEEAPHLQAA